jgi:V8-like Glu-specific endopeptidase
VIPAIIGGTADTADASVVAIVTAADAGTPELCSGTVIAPRVVLTAGHCALNQAPGDLTVRVGANVLAPDREVGVAQVVPYPGFAATGDDARQGRDIAALVTTDDVGVPALPYARDGSAVAGLAGQTVTDVGYGATAPEDATSPGTKRIAEMTVSAVCDRLIAFGDAQRRACIGDSGGPLLVGEGSGAPTVVGVVSFYDGTQCGPPVYAVRVDPYAAWLDTIVAGTPDTTCASSCPPPGTPCAAPDAGVDAGAPSDAAPEASGGPALRASGAGCGVASPAGGRWPGAVAFGFVGVVLSAAMRRVLRPRPASRTSPGAAPAGWAGRRRPG